MKFYVKTSLRIFSVASLDIREDHVKRVVRLEVMDKIVNKSVDVRTRLSVHIKMDLVLVQLVGKV